MQPAEIQSRLGWWSCGPSRWVGVGCVGRGGDDGDGSGGGRALGGSQGGIRAAQPERNAGCTSVGASDASDVSPAARLLPVLDNGTPPLLR